MRKQHIFGLSLQIFLGLTSAACYSDACLNRVDCGEDCLADCSKYLEVTVTPAAVTVSTTVAAANALSTSTTQDPTPRLKPGLYLEGCDQRVIFPIYAAVCNDFERYASACSCLGMSVETTTVATPTIIVTITTGTNISLSPETGTTTPSATATSTELSSAVSITPAVSSPSSVTEIITSPPQLNPTETPTTTGASSSTTTENVPVILTVVPSIPNTNPNSKPGTPKRQEPAGGFVSDEATAAPICTDGTPFNLTLGQLTSDGLAVTTDPGFSFTELTPSPGGSILTTFFDADDVLHWQNDTFYQGEAGFCQVPSGKIFATFTSEDGWPLNCAPISILVYKARQCQNGVIVPEDDSTRTSSIASTTTSFIEAPPSTDAPLSPSPRRVVFKRWKICGDRSNEHIFPARDVASVHQLSINPYIDYYGDNICDVDIFIGKFSAHYDYNLIRIIVVFCVFKLGATRVPILRAAFPIVIRTTIIVVLGTSILILGTNILFLGTTPILRTIIPIILRAIIPIIFRTAIPIFGSTITVFRSTITVFGSTINALIFAFNNT
ncbi:hypothetical protein F4778DRAFT_798793 [Xylariomycetidae sp. FL2044]|nr:hypothetical protein F4778DRAFT_798793 [Xylariomycetidae sp. FL2044]